MKRLLLLMMFLVTVFQGFSQTKGISYQAVILNPKAQEIPGANAEGNILANQAVSIQFTVVNASGITEYQEEHSTSTDRYGMINLLIGTGTSTSGNDFSTIFWDGATKKLNVGIDFSGGSNFSPLSEQNLTYIPQPPTEEVSIEITRISEAISTEITRATQAEHNNSGAISILQGEQTTQNIAIGLNTEKVSYPGDQDISGIATNTTAISAESATARAAESTNSGAISMLIGEQTTQNIAIGLNTSKVSYPGDQDISGIAANATSILEETTRATQAESTNSGAISILQGEQTTQNTAIALNTEKVSYPGDQDISGIATNTTAISEESATARAAESTNSGAISILQGEQTTQNTAIVLNTEKVSYPGDQDISGIATNTTAISAESATARAAEATNAGAISILHGEQTTQNTAIALNTSKVSYPGDQDISGIATNTTAISAESVTARAAESTNAGAISILQGEQTTQNTAIALNTEKVSYPGDQDISGIAINAGAISAEVTRAGLAEVANETTISSIQAEQTTQNSAIELNTAKVGLPINPSIGDMSYWDGNDWLILKAEGGTVGQVLTLNSMGIPAWANISTGLTFYEDADGDGFGDINSTVVANAAPNGYVDNNTDCDDTPITGATIYPGATEVADDGIDQDCDGVDLLTWYADADGDTYGDASITTNSNTQPAGYVAANTDCDDTLNTGATIYPGAIEVVDDGIDQDCDGLDVVTWYADADGDTFGDASITSTASTKPAGYVADNTDCDDTLSETNPATVWYLDADGDNYAISTVTQCANPGTGYTTTLLPLTDCNDSKFAVNPGVIEILANGIDDDCDGKIDEAGVAIGDLHAGGIVFWVDPTDNRHGLVCAIEDQGYGSRFNSSYYNYVTTGATSTAIGTGAANTDAIILAQGSGNYAASVARAYNGGGFNDWFLPSKDELNTMYLNKAAIEAKANGGTSFNNYYYLSSTEHNRRWVLVQSFTNGSQGPVEKHSTGGVRAVRAF